jgi:hypothetical protein
MNCFDVRKRFAAYWRRAIPPAERALLVEHLATCAQCDHAFRVFALSAPVIHSQGRAEATNSLARPPLNLVRVRRFAGARSESLERREPQRPWRVAAAAVALLMIGGISAWSSIQWPERNFADGVVADVLELEPVNYSLDNSATAFDAAAQEPAPFDSIAPELPALSDNGLAG